jgi:hypothetical protein
MFALAIQTAVWSLKLVDRERPASEGVPKEVEASNQAVN